MSFLQDHDPAEPWQDEEVPPYLSAWRRQHDEITEDEALADLFNLGLRCQRTYAAYRREELRMLNRSHGVIEHVTELRRALILAAPIIKPGVHRFTAFFAPATQMTGYCTQSELRVALEQKICTRAKP